MYNYLDERLEKLQKDITRCFNRSKATMDFDELHVLSKTKTLYKELEELNKKYFLDIAKYYYKESYYIALYGDEVKHKEETSKEKAKLNRDINYMWLAPILSGYDPVSKFVYNHEVERKRARLTEALISTHTKNDNFKVAHGYWKRQSVQYALTVCDWALLQGYKDLGYKEVVWHTEEDSRVCKTCKKRNRKRYPINSVPNKPHYLCRCWLEVVK